MCTNDDIQSVCKPRIKAIFKQYVSSSNNSLGTNVAASTILHRTKVQLFSKYTRLVFQILEFCDFLHLEISNGNKPLFYNNLSFIRASSLDENTSPNFMNSEYQFFKVVMVGEIKYVPHEGMTKLSARIIEDFYCLHTEVIGCQ